jgi:hypothetical protein
MSLNKSSILGLIFLCVSGFTHGEKIDLEQMLKDTPVDELERLKELRRLDFVSQKLEKLAKIKVSEQKINEATASNKASSKNTITLDSQSNLSDLEKTIQEQLFKSSKSRTGTSIPTRSNSSNNMKLISLWGNKDSPTADVLFNGNEIAVKKGSTIDDWKVSQVSSQYLVLVKSGRTKKLFFSN